MAKGLSRKSTVHEGNAGGKSTLRRFHYLMLQERTFSLEPFSTDIVHFPLLQGSINSSKNGLLFKYGYMKIMVQFQTVFSEFESTEVDAILSYIVTCDLLMGSQEQKLQQILCSSLLKGSYQCIL